MRSAHGPPVPHPWLVAARTTLDTAYDPVDIVEAVLAIRDLTARTIPVGGGFALPGRARGPARDVVAALDYRGLLARQGRLL